MHGSLRSKRNKSKPFQCVYLIAQRKKKGLTGKVWKHTIMLCFESEKVKKLQSVWGSAPDPNGGAYSTPPYPLAVRFCPLAEPIQKGFPALVQMLHVFDQCMQCMGRSCTDDDGILISVLCLPNFDIGTFATL